MKHISRILILFLASCSKDDNNPPQDKLLEATTTVASTAGCYIVGELLIPKNGSQAIGGPPAYRLTTGAGNNFDEPIVRDDYKYVRIANLRVVGNFTEPNIKKELINKTNK